MSDGIPPIKDAPAPFSGEPDPDDNIPPSDFILRTGDGVDFHVHKDILKFVSIFFKNMLEGSGDVAGLQRNGKPVAELPEKADVMYKLLSIAYPGRSPQPYSLTPQGLDGVWEVHEAAQKYLFTGAKELVEKMLEDAALVNASPHRVFAIAVLRDLRDLASKAALATLNFPVCPALELPELRLLTAATFQALHNFHHRCGQRAESLVRMHTASLEPIDIGDYNSPNPYITKNVDFDTVLVWWATGSAAQHETECGPRHEFQMDSDWCDPAPWFRTHSARLAAALRISPIRRTVLTEATNVAPAERELINSCHACIDCADRDLNDFANQLASRIEASNQEQAQTLLDLL